MLLGVGWVVLALTLAWPPCLGTRRVVRYQAAVFLEMSFLYLFTRMGFKTRFRTCLFGTLYYYDIFIASGYIYINGFACILLLKEKKFSIISPQRLCMFIFPRICTTK